MREIHSSIQHRRWFSGENVDLFIHLDKKFRIKAIELCYQKLLDEHVILIKATGSISHVRVDDGECQGYAYKQSPVITSEDPIPDSEALYIVLQYLKRLDVLMRKQVLRFVSRYCKE